MKNSELSSRPSLNSEFDERRELERLLEVEPHDITQIIEQEEQSGHGKATRVQLNPCSLLAGVPSVEVFVEQANGLRRLNFSGQRIAKERVNNGDREALQELVVTGIPWVFRVAQNHCCERQAVDEFLDFFQEGILGLVEAIKRWNPEEGPLQTYASAWIMQRIQRYVAMQGSTLRLPVHIQEKRTKILREVREKGNVPPHIGDVELARWLPPLSLNSDLSWVLQSQIEDQILSPKDDPLPDDEHLFEAIVDPYSLEEDVIERIYREEVRAWLDHSTLSERQKFVIFERYGFNADGREKTLEEVGTLLGVTRERVRQIEAKAIKRLRHPTRLELIRVSDKPSRRTYKECKRATPLTDQHSPMVASPRFAKEGTQYFQPAATGEGPSGELGLVRLAFDGLLGDFKPTLRNIAWYIDRLNDSEVEHFWKSLFDVGALQQLLTNKQWDVIREAIKEKDKLSPRSLEFMRRALVRLYRKLRSID